jgi:hypothetical protein
MQLSPYVQAIQADLAAAAALGDETSADAGRRLSQALESSLHLRLLDLLTEAAASLSADVPGRVEVRLAGRDPELVYVEDEPAAAPTADDGLTARITLRLPEALKVSVELRADAEGVSTNAWVVRALAQALTWRAERPGARRMSGYAQS